MLFNFVLISRVKINLHVLQLGMIKSLSESTYFKNKKKRFRESSWYILHYRHIQKMLVPFKKGDKDPCSEAWWRSLKFLIYNFTCFLSWYITYMFIHLSVCIHPHMYILFLETGKEFTVTDYLTKINCGFHLKYVLYLVFRIK